MNNEELTTIALRNDTKKELDKLKIHPNQSYDELISKILIKLKKHNIL